MTQATDHQIDYSKPHAFELEQGRITPVCKCGAPQLTQIHFVDGLNAIQAPFTKLTNTCLLKADADMPLFVLKPTDASAISVMEYWYMQNIGTSPREKLDGVMELRSAFMKWQDAHRNRVHNPD